METWQQAAPVRILMTREQSREQEVEKMNATIQRARRSWRRVWREYLDGWLRFWGISTPDDELDEPEDEEAETWRPRR